MCWLYGTGYTQLRLHVLCFVCQIYSMQHKFSQAVHIYNQPYGRSYPPIDERLEYSQDACAITQQPCNPNLQVNMRCKNMGRVCKHGRYWDGAIHLTLVLKPGSSTPSPGPSMDIGSLLRINFLCASRLRSWRVICCSTNTCNHLRRWISAPYCELSFSVKSKRSLLYMDHLKDLPFLQVPVD